MTEQMKNGKSSSRLKLCWQDKVFYTVCYAVMVVLTIIVLYPIIYIVSASFSSGSALARGDVWLFPVEFTLAGYERVLKYDKIWIGYRNTILYTVAGTAINVVMTLICAYPLARKNLRGRGPLMFLFSFTMLFSGGMIPGYLLMKNLHLLNTVWVMLLPGAISVYNMIVARTFIQNNIADELLEAAKVDGCSDIRFFFQMVLPLSKAVIAVLCLWYAVGHWNAYFNAFLYLTNEKLYPLQLFLKDILVASDVGADMIMDIDELEAAYNLKSLLKYAVIVVSTVPMFAFYPIVQKYFKQGVMIGALKG